MYKHRKVISVRYLNKSEEHPLSRPHKIQRITKADDSVHYYTMNNSREIKPEEFVTTWDKKPKQTSTKATAKWEVTRVKFVNPETGKLSRPKKVYSITLGNDVQYAPYGEKNTGKRIDVSQIVITWKNAGHTPTSKPLRKYCDESLKSMGYTIEEIRKIRERNFSSKDIDLVAKNLGIKRSEAKELLVESNGNRHKIYKKKETRGQTLGDTGVRDTLAGVQKQPKKERQNTKDQLRKELQSRPNKSKKKKRSSGRF